MSLVALGVHYTARSPVTYWLNHAALLPGALLLMVVCNLYHFLVGLPGPIGLITHSNVVACLNALTSATAIAICCLETIEEVKYG